MPVSHKKAWYPLIAAIVLIGAQATMAQVLLVRELLVVFYGNELCLGVIFGTWLMGVAIGAGIGSSVIRRFAKNPPEADDPSRAGVVGLEKRLAIFLFLVLALCFALPMQVAVIRLLRYIVHVPYGQHISILSLLWSSPLIIMPFSFIIGFIFPFSTQVFRGFTRGAATDIGTVYVLESLGSLIGGSLFTFVLAPRVASFETMAILNAVVLVNLLLVVSLIGRASPRRALLGLSIPFLTVSLWLIFSGEVKEVEEFFVGKRWQSFNPTIKLIESVDSKYQNIVIGKEEDQYSVYGNGQYTFAFPNLYEYGPMAHLVLSEHPFPRRVLLIGAGIGGLISEMLRYPLEELHYVELDPKLLEVAEKYLPEEDRVSLADKRVKIFHLDGRYFVKKAKGRYKYDVVFLNVPDPSTASLNRFYTLEFFREAQALLEHDGVLVTSISSAVTYIGEVVGNYTGSIYRTLREVFPYVVVTPGQTNHYFASSSPDIVTTDLDTLINRYKLRNIQTKYFTEYHFVTFLEPRKVRFLEGELKRRKNLPLNTDSRPVTYYFNLLLWDQFSGGQLQGLLRWMGRAKPWFFLGAVGLFLVVRLAVANLLPLSLDRQRKFNSLFAIATTGFAGIALEIILIFSFQNIYGYVYERIGLIVALFMLGLAIGGYISSALLLRKERDWSRVLMYMVGGMVLYTMTLVLILRWFPFHWTGSEAFFMVLIVVPGILTGLEFPIASRIYLEAKVDSGVTAGLMDCADHVGAFAGAILTGIVMVPILGIDYTCLVIAALNGASLVLLSTLVFKKKSLYK